MKIAINDSCKESFGKIKFQKSLRYLVFKIEKEEIVLEKKGQRQENWNDFLKALPPKEYRYCIFDLEYKSHDGMNRSKLFFCNWLPECPMKLKMIYATGKQNFKSYLDLVGKEICISSIDQMSEAELIKEFDK